MVQIAKRITVWYYPGNRRLTQSQIRRSRRCSGYALLQRQRVHGIRIIRAVRIPPSKETDWESIDILAHLFQQLLWNAEMTEEEFQAEIDDYLYVLYGEGGKFVGDYYKWLETTDLIGCWPFMIAFGNPATALTLRRCAMDSSFASRCSTMR